MTKKEYLKIVTNICECSERKYKKDMKFNFVILENGISPLCWDGRAIIYGSKKDCEFDLEENDTVITEQEYFDKFLTD